MKLLQIKNKIILEIDQKCIGLMISSDLKKKMNLLGKD